MTTENFPGVSKNKRAVFNLFLLFLSFYLLCSAGHFYVKDEATRARVAASIVENGTIAIPDGDGDVGRGGRLYGKYGIVQSLLTVPLYAAGRFANQVLHLDVPFMPFVLMSLFNSIVTALCVVLLFSVALRMGFGWRSSLALSLVYGFCTLAWPYAKTFFTEPLVALWFLLAFRTQAPGAGSGCNTSSSRFLLSGVYLGVAVLTRHEVVVLAAVWLMVTFVFSGNHKWRNSIIQASPVFLAGLIQLLFNWYRFGAPQNFGYRTETFSSSMLTGLYGLLLSPGKGIVFFCPAVLLGIAGFAALARRNRSTAALCAAIPLAALALYSKWNLWGGDLSWGPRYLVSVLPFIMLPAAELFERIFSEPRSAHALVRKTLVAFAIAASFAVQIPAVVIDFHSYTDIMAAAMYTNGDETYTSVPMFDRIYFQPRYSPIAAHVEYMRIMFTGDPDSSRLNPLGLPDIRNRIKSAAKPDFLIWGYLKKFADAPKKKLLIYAFAAVCVAAFAVSMISLLRISPAKK